MNGIDQRVALLGLAAALLAGCADIAPPRLLHPGSEQYQQARAERFDPYPLPDVGPDVVGGRPMEYIKPAPWAERVQNETTYEERFHQAPPPGLYKPSRAATGRQGIVYPVPGAEPLGVQPLAAPQAPVVTLPAGTSPPFTP